MMKTALASLILAWIFPAPPAAKAPPSLELQGSAARLDQSCVRLTPDEPWASGSAWAKSALSLNQAFDLEMSLAFGVKDRLGADGVVFVLAPQRRTGWRGEGLGFAGLRGSVGIEIDTYANYRQNDPEADHLALVLDGRPSHHGSYGVVDLPNVEDGRRHAFRIKWSPKADTLEVFFDGELRATYPGQIIRHVLGDDAVVNWGLTAGTGRKSNAQDVCFEH